MPSLGPNADICLITRNDINFSMKSLSVVKGEIDKSLTLVPENPRFTLIWLHGLGDTPYGFLDFFQLPCSPVNDGARVKLLRAPVRPVTINKGIPSTSWYDIKSMNVDNLDDDFYSLDEVRESMDIVDKHVREQIGLWAQKGSQETAESRVFIGGFSQGCAMSLIYGLTCEHRLGGIVGLSGHLFPNFQFKHLQKIPILLYHGKSDIVIPFQKAKLSYNKIQGKDLVTFREKQLGHEVSIEELKQIREWFANYTKTY